MMPEVTPVPWIDSLEFRTVGRCLLSAVHIGRDDESKTLTPLTVEDALKRAESWKVRSMQPLPASVESTMALAMAIWRDKGNGYPSSSTGITTTPFLSEVRMMYSCAIIRAINGLADPFQQNRAMVGSVAQICSQIGVPLWLVDLRHEATHNQLPSLSVLRSGAITLLNYLQNVYWDPLERVQKRDHETIWRYLDDYLDAMSRSCGVKEEFEFIFKSEDTEVLAGVDKGALDEEASPSTQDYFDYGSSSGDEVHGSTSYMPSHAVRLGTNANMFAALMDEKKSKRKKEDQVQTLTSENNKNSSSKRRASHPPEFFLDQLFSSKIMLDAVWHALLCYLLYGFSETDRGIRELGYLVPSSERDFPCTKDGTEKIRRRFYPLLSQLAKQWPGFINCLLIHMVDCLLKISSQSEQEGRQRNLFFLEAWIKYLLSRTFTCLCGVTSSEPPHGSNDTASVQDLSHFGYPLKWLCDRLEAYASSNNGDFSVQRIHSLFRSILGQERIVKNPESKQSVADISDTPCDGGMSLSEMEAMLSGDSIEAASPALSNQDLALKGDETIQDRYAWKRCTEWEPCAIGTLPGFPV